jgi:hypothetical protein
LTQRGFVRGHAIRATTRFLPAHAQGCDNSKLGNLKYAFRNDITGIVSTGPGYRFVTKTLQLLTPHR